MDKYWSIRQIGNGYIVTYPYIAQRTDEVAHASLFKPTFKEALELLDENSMQPNPEKDIPK